jgi:hypothetical protein
MDLDGLNQDSNSLNNQLLVLEQKPYILNILLVFFPLLLHFSIKGSTCTRIILFSISQLHSLISFNAPKSFLLPYAGTSKRTL